MKFNLCTIQLCSTSLSISLANSFLMMMMIMVWCEFNFGSCVEFHLNEMLCFNSCMEINMINHDGYDILILCCPCMKLYHANGDYMDLVWMMMIKWLFNQFAYYFRSFMVKKQIRWINLLTYLNEISCGFVLK